MTDSPESFTHDKPSSDSSSPEADSQPAGDTPARSAPRWLVAVIVALVAAAGYMALAQHQSQVALQAQLEEARQLLVQLDQRTATLETNYEETRAHLHVASDKLGVTEKELARARANARRLRADQKKAAEELTAKLQEHETQLVSITDEVVEVRDEVAETREGLEETRSSLQTAVGDLGMQSGLIARNREELEELKRLGERDYYEFDLVKSREFTRIGDTSLRLNKTDAKRNRFTLTVLVEDKRVEKKDRTLLEPVQFYTADSSQLLELVVFELDKNRVAGYLSVPKMKMARRGPVSERE